MGRWTPIAPCVTAEVLAARDKRLIRNSQDALDGVVAAIEEFGRRLHARSPSDLDDLWNRHRGGSATPKEEERFSDKICVAVREYFRDFAVVADREAQIARRLVPAHAGGAPGSEVDVLTLIPAVGAVDGDAIVIPIELKLSYNREARTGLHQQLVDRYMQELDTDVGVYVVVWVGTDKRTRRRAMWASIDEAMDDLQSSAKTAVASRPNTDVRAVLVNAMLPVSKASAKYATTKRNVRKVSNRKAKKRNSRRLAITKLPKPKLKKRQKKRKRSGG